MRTRSFGGVRGTTVADAQPGLSPLPRPRTGSPNVVIVVLDDVGFADLGCYGSEIATPSMDRLAAGGLRYRNFHVTPLCSPTRASLLTGRNHHKVGMRFLAEVDTGFSNCRGRISETAAPLSQILVSQGYNTWAVGKWHLAPLTHTTHAGPFDHWPLGKGFQRFYGFMGGWTDQYVPELVYDNHRLPPPARSDYHLSEDLVDRAIGFVRDQAATTPDNPFFLYLAFGAAHAPHQVPRQYVDKYVSLFENGWDQTRLDRLGLQKQLGIVPAHTRLTERNADVPPWDSLTADEKRFFVRLQAAYAGFLEHTDEQTGRLVDFLRSIGTLDNTLIMLLSDNGASPEGSPAGMFNVLASYNGLDEDLAENLGRLDQIGSPAAANHYPTGWAMASNTPFRRYKRFVDGGGVNTPLIVHWPAGIADAGAVREQFVHAIDVAPTILEVLGVPVPETVLGVPQMPMDGRSIATTFDHPTAPSPRDTQYFEMFGHRAIWHRGWKAISFHHTGTPYESDEWWLYDLESDFSECRDLAAQQPGVLRQLQDLWWIEAARHDVLPLDDRLMNALLQRKPIGEHAGRTTRVYYPGQTYLPAHAVPDTGDSSFELWAEVDRGDRSEEGVLVAVGGRASGYVLYIADNRLYFEYNCLGTRSVAASSVDVPVGPSRLGFRFQRTGSSTGVGTLCIDEREVAETAIPRLLHGLPSGLEVGRNSRSPVSERYTGRGDFAFPAGSLRRVLFTLGPDQQPDPNALATALAEQ
ncbi:MAG: arylsulfatase [Chloroflexota bacterium]